MSFTQLESHSQLLCGRDFAAERVSIRQVDVRGSALVLIINKIKQNYLK